MPSKLRYFETDPNGLGRGPGYYYLRTGKHGQKFILADGKTIVGPYFSKYNREKDRHRLSQGWKTDKVGIPKKIAQLFAHVTDGYLSKKRVQKQPKKEE